MYARAGQKILLERYELVAPLSQVPTSQRGESWIGIDNYQVEHLLRIWPFSSGEADDLQRALWDIELRTLYRVSSSPGAQDSLLTLRDAGLDHDNKCFVMVLQGRGVTGYETLEDAIGQRMDYSWLSNRSLDARGQLWAGMLRIAQGIHLLHTQAVLHRCIDASRILLKASQGPESFRLSGFEWSVRIGELQPHEPQVGWATPPESGDQVKSYRMEGDWYGLGMLAARCLLSIEAGGSLDPRQRQKLVISQIEDPLEVDLSELEKVVLRRFIAQKEPDRLMRGGEVLSAIESVVHALREANRSQSDRPLTLAYNQNDTTLAEECEAVGFRANPIESVERYNPNDQNHSIRLSSFIQEDLKGAKLYLLGDSYLLMGRRLGFRIGKFGWRDLETRELRESWDAAFCIGVMYLPYNEGGTTCHEIPSNGLIVRTLAEVYRNRGALLARSPSWEQFLPFSDKGSGLRSSLGKFLDFVRCSNQIELLMRDSEIFRYEVIERLREKDRERLVVREVERSERPVMPMLRMDGGLIEFLQGAFVLSKENSDKVVMSSLDALRFPTTVDLKDCYTVVAFEKRAIENEDGRAQDVDCVLVDRVLIGNAGVSAPDSGWVRSFGMFGQVDLIRRRLEAIGRLESHSFLLAALTATGQVFMDSLEFARLGDVPEDEVDIQKKAVMQDILRTRPIYALQGPPGTGKTTMVAHLLRQIFKDDPVAQVLITAQAHGAVDVLRDKVRTEAFAGVEEDKLPLAIRLGRRSEGYSRAADSVEEVAISILKRSVEELEGRTITPIQSEWLKTAEVMEHAIRSHTPGDTTPEFCELVKRGANLVYCTTSAGDLEQLARSTQYYDWAIVEEAGKCHGFDLALPLQLGHRWLLIGDQSQLPPYRMTDWIKAVTNMDEVVACLQTLPARASGLLDSEWIERWEAMTPSERAEFKNLSLYWLKPFERIFENCERAPSGSLSLRRTEKESNGAAAGMLLSQYRMHPTIGTLISETYYEGRVLNMTGDASGSAADYVRLPVTSPEEIRDVGIVWIDTPWSDRQSETSERGPEDGAPRYSNPFEVKVLRGFLGELELGKTASGEEDGGEMDSMKLAVLSPYNQQVRLLRSELQEITLPEGLEPKEALHIQRRDILGSRGRSTFTHTVDSFQGNEADIVVVSLVRNNTLKKGALGFLEDKERMNVLLSRAQRLLVLLGSWEFFWRQVEAIPLDDKERDLWHLKRAMTLISGWFEDKRAVKLDSSRFLS